MLRTSEHAMSCIVDPLEAGQARRGYLIGFVVVGDEITGIVADKEGDMSPEPLNKIRVFENVGEALKEMTKIKTGVDIQTVSVTSDESGQ